MGFLFIVIYLVLILLVLEIASTLLVISGLDKDIARFQAVSMLTSTGFTTKESELILRHPLRRKIAAFLILFGVFSLAVLISTLSQVMAQSFRIPQVTAVTLGLGVVLAAVKSKRMMKLLTRKFHRELEREFELHELPIEEILYTGPDDWVTSVPIFPESEAVGRRVAEVFLPEEDVRLLLLQRGDQKIRRDCMKLKVQEGDLLFVYGSRTAIERKFRRELEKMQSETKDEEHIVAID